MPQSPPRQLSRRAPSLSRTVEAMRTLRRRHPRGAAFDRELRLALGAARR